jgi:hypothetical protein
MQTSSLETRHKGLIPACFRPLRLSRYLVPAWRPAEQIQRAIGRLSQSASIKIKHIRYPKTDESGRCLKPRDNRVKAVTRTHISWGLDFVRIGR